MSESIDNSKQRLNALLNFSQGIIKGKDGTDLLKKYGESLKFITPHDMIAMEEEQLKRGIKPGVIKNKIEKVMNVIYDHLRNYQWNKPGKGHPIYYFMQENRELEKLLQKMKEELKQQDIEGIITDIEALFSMERHYLRKENILFPFLEQTWENCRPLSVMWSLHDDIRMKLKEVQSLLQDKCEFTPQLYRAIGDLFFLMYGMIFKEELVIFPVAMETLSQQVWKKIAEQSYDIGFSFIASDPEFEINASHHEFQKQKIKIPNKIFQSRTGNLSQKQLEGLFNTLPFDLTFINENDEVEFFSDPKDRFFPRSPAVIGRKVQNCHPPESVHIVEKILSAFKAGRKDEALFHINMRGKFILIRYFAVRDREKAYLGTLEVTQDLTDLKDLKGDKRLLDWE